MSHFGLEVLQYAFHAAAADVRPEELGREIRDLVSLVENDGIAGAEDVAEAVLLQRKIGEQQVVIDDDNVRVERLPPGHRNMTARHFGTAVAQAVLAGRSDLWPYGV